MKKTLLKVGMLLTTFSTFSQSASNSLGNSVNYFNSLANSKSRLTESKINVDGKEVAVSIKSSDETSVIGSLKENGSFLKLKKSGNKVTGQLVLSYNDKFAYNYTTDAKGNLILTKVDINQVLCIDYGKDNIADPSNGKRIENVNAAPRGTLQSLPGSPNVILIDFDGYNLPAGTPWLNGAARVVKGVNYTEAEEEQVWDNVAEDYAAFNVNITTSEAVYQAASQTNRMRVVVTRDEVTPGGGVALLNSFGDEKAKCCWAYPNKIGDYPLATAECVSHEAGHTLGMNHDGSAASPSYYGGHAGWAPIMGNSYRSTVTHWSKGEYSTANNQQDDLARITQDLPYRTDDHANTNTSATEINYTIDATGKAIVSASANKGNIERNTDIDVFHFYLSGGQINLVVKPTCTQRTNLDIQVSLVDKAGTLIEKYATSHVSNTIKNGVTITKSLPKGDYYLQVDGIGTGNAITGWSDYNSMGLYAISGNIVGITQKDNDAGVLGINNIFNVNCGNAITPSIQLINGGLKTLTSVTAEVFIDNVSKSKELLMVNIGSGITKNVNLKTINFTTFGSKTIKIVLSMPNGVADELNVNDEFSKTFTINAGGLVQFSISTLSKDNALTWNITSGGTAVSDNTKNTAVKTGDKEITEFCLAEDKCYTFTTTKAFKENTCAVYPAWNATTQYKVGDIVVFKGNVYKANSPIWTVEPTTAWYDLIGPCPVVNTADSFTLNNVAESTIVSTVLYSEYKSPYKVDFCTKRVTDLEEANTSYSVNSIFPNPTVNELFISSVSPIVSITVYNLQSELVAKQVGSAEKILLHDLTAGSYIVKVETENGNFNKLIVKK